MHISLQMLNTFDIFLDVSLAVFLFLFSAPSLLFACRRLSRWCLESFNGVCRRRFPMCVFVEVHANEDAHEDRKMHVHSNLVTCRAHRLFARARKMIDDAGGQRHLVVSTTI